MQWARAVSLLGLLGSLAGAVFWAGSRYSEAATTCAQVPALAGRVEALERTLMLHTAEASELIPIVKALRTCPPFMSCLPISRPPAWSP